VPHTLRTPNGSISNNPGHIIALATELGFDI
jgi:hypothetical protein